MYYCAPELVTAETKTNHVFITKENANKLIQHHKRKRKCTIISI